MITLLVELRPALEGFAGIPQEVRLLFQGLTQLPGVEVEGLLQTSTRVLPPGVADEEGAAFNPATAKARYAKVTAALAEVPGQTPLARAARGVRARMTSSWLALTSSIGQDVIRLTRFDSSGFAEATWRSLFANSLPASDFDSVAYANHRVCSVPWKAMHVAGLATLRWRRTALYPRLRTRDVDLFIGQTPYPGRVSAGTGMIIRYHDAIPVLMPETTRGDHAATHLHALRSNVRHGAWFACVSDATRSDLVKLVPEAAPRAVTIHNMVSHHFFPEAADGAAAPRIVRRHLYQSSGWLPAFPTENQERRFYDRHLDTGDFHYLLMVSTLEPRKNHLRLIAAWQQLKAENDPSLKLVIVGTLGWDHDDIRTALAGPLERGEAFLLNAVPGDELRALYRNAAATVCPSLGEGFGFSGIEAMRSGGIAIASDIPVHREIYDDAAVYFDPQSTASLVESLMRTLYGNQSRPIVEQKKQRGREVGDRYLPDVIVPQWGRFLALVTASR